MDELLSLLGGMGSDISSLFSGLGSDALSLFGGSSGNPLAAFLQMLAMGSSAYNSQEQANYASDISGQQLNALGIATNPAKLSTQINQMIQYMTPTQQRAVLGPAESAAASRGMAASPGQMQMIDEQAMAPYYNQEYQNAEQAALTGLGLPFKTQPSWPTSNNNFLNLGGGSNSNSSMNSLLDMMLASQLGGGSSDSALDPFTLASLFGGSSGGSLGSMFGATGLASLLGAGGIW